MIASSDRNHWSLPKVSDRSHFRKVFAIPLRHGKLYKVKIVVIFFAQAYESTLANPICLGGALDAKTVCSTLDWLDLVWSEVKDVPIFVPFFLLEPYASKDYDLACAERTHSKVVPHEILLVSNQKFPATSLSV